MGLLFLLWRVFPQVLSSIAEARRPRDCILEYQVIVSIRLSLVAGHRHDMDIYPQHMSRLNGLQSTKQLQQSGKYFRASELNSSLFMPAIFFHSFTGSIFLPLHHGPACILHCKAHLGRMQRLQQGGLDLSFFGHLKGLICCRASPVWFNTV
jgi:hypothetical protein